MGILSPVLATRDYAPFVNDSSLVVNLNGKHPNSYLNPSATWNNLANFNNNFKIIGGTTFNRQEGSILYNGAATSYNISTTNPFGTMSKTSLFTICAWVKIIAYPGVGTTYTSRFIDFDMVLNNFDVSLTLGVYNSSTSTKRISITTGKAGVASSDISDSIDYNLNTWYYVVGVFNGGTSTATLYINGSQKNSGSYNASCSTSTSSTTGMTLGAERYASGIYYYGNIRLAKVHCYNRLLTSAEILANYTQDAQLFLGNINQ